MTPDIEQIHREIDERIAKRGIYLNNFWGRLPWDINFSIEKMEEWVKKIGDDEALKFGFDIRIWRIVSGKLDVKHGELHENEKGPEDWRHSYTYNNQTPREFFHTIDRVVTELGVDLAGNPQITPGASMTREANDLYQKRIFPIYMKLREMGYNDTDLII